MSSSLQQQLLQAKKTPESDRLTSNKSVPFQGLRYIVIPTDISSPKQNKLITPALILCAGLSLLEELRNIL